MTGWRFAINQITTPSLACGPAIDLYARNGIHGIAYWVDHARESGGTATVAKHAADAGSFAASLCTSSWMTEGNLEQAIEENKLRLDMAAELGAPVLVMVVGGATKANSNIALDRNRVSDGLAALCDHGKNVGVSIGLEPLHPMYAASRSCLNTYAQCHELMLQLGPATSLVPDIYHCWWDPGFLSHLSSTNPDRISTFHLCDWLSDTRNFRDRGMVGDGIADIAGTLNTLAQIGYQGDFELEIFSKLDWWKRDPEDVVRIAAERCLPLLAAHKPSELNQNTKPRVEELKC
ncbi:MAG: sugar phosphate isomerase/epimerase [Rhodobacteraceae bacterium]|nr:sugar phosphate isomerase/epimerase [Paracoccaceae bacterium]